MEGKVLLRCCLATLMISVVTKAVAVDGNHLDFSPQTPEAAAFQQVGDIPVGNYTGTMNLSIPLYTIECANQSRLSWLCYPCGPRSHVGGPQLDIECWRCNNHKTV